MWIHVSTERHSLAARKRNHSINFVNRQRVLEAMRSRRLTTSLEPFLGTYRIVWDSESNCDPREELFDDARLDRDPCDGLFTLTRPHYAQAWPKEPTASTGVVLRLRDSFLGTNRTASILDSSLPPLSRYSAYSTPHSASMSSLSLLAASPTSPSDDSPTSQSSLCSASSRDPSASSATRSRGFWRFDWDPSFPRLGFRFEGMDLTGPRDHALSFSEIRDDHGHPFAVLEFRPTGWEADRDGHDARRQRSAEECAKTRAARKGRACCIFVVAKRVRDRYDREGLSDAERERLGMRELPVENAGF
ncbi:hypothetical protein BN946_scf184281.g4 [Trametes cinnabarina]|uniref:Uncharacterized protein n=1 Tax=Pycnoporus cinnabarinus TaxID=5643 RepID=A0A060SWS4_PYCCI|nr:hypothetical protein BN946_scf184281.g4 [Trametes cinnabarina]